MRPRHRNVAIGLDNLMSSRLWTGDDLSPTTDLVLRLKFFRSKILASKEIKLRFLY